MQADEEVGKVAQVAGAGTLHDSLVTKSAAQAKEKNSKKATAQHLKQRFDTPPLSKAS